MSNESWRDELDDLKYIDFKQGPFVGIFKDVRSGKNKWGECRVVVFTNKNGKEQTYETNSKRLLGQLKNVPYGAKVKIVRIGESTNTHFEVEVLNNPHKEEVDERVKQVAKDFDGTVSSGSGGWDE